MNNTYPGLFVSKEFLDSSVTLPPKYPVGWNRKIFQPDSGLGLLYRSPLEEGDRDTFTFNGIEMEFVDYFPTKKDGTPFNYIRGSYTKEVNCGTFSFHLSSVHISQINLDELKKMELWTVLSEEEHKQLEARVLLPVENLRTPSDPESQDVNKPKKTRNDPAHANLPRELNCCTEDCEGKMPYISPNMLIAKAAEKGVTPEEYSKTWKCSRCEPKRRGRAANEKWIGKVNELKCPCGFSSKQHPSMIDKLATAAGKTYDQYIADYLCRNCKPESTNTTTTRGRKMSPDSPWFGKAKEVVCKCGKAQKQHASITDAQAKKAGLSFDEYVASWKCRECRNLENPLSTTTTTTCRGRKPNPEFVGLPKSMTCKCGKTVNSNLHYLKQKSQESGTTIQKLIEEYQCRKCASGKLVEI